MNRGLRGERGFTEGNKGNKDGQNHEAEMLRYRDAGMEKRTEGSKPLMDANKR